MTSQSIKLNAFEYLISLLIHWYKEISSDGKNMQFTRVKVLKLLFFVATVKNDDGSDLLDIFNKFYAMQLGPVESDIYNFMSRGVFTHYDFKSIEMKIIDDSESFDLSDIIKHNIDCSITTIKTLNNRLITYSPFELVTLSHKWESWRLSFTIAEINGKGSALMNTQLIRADLQHYCL